jgi:hypothetical protein
VFVELAAGTEDAGLNPKIKSTETPRPFASADGAVEIPVRPDQGTAGFTPSAFRSGLRPARSH